MGQWTKALQVSFYFEAGNILTFNNKKYWLLIVLKSFKLFKLNLLQCYKLYSLGIKLILYLKKMNSEDFCLWKFAEANSDYNKIVLVERYVNIFS